MKCGDDYCGLKTYFAETIVVGSGAAGYNAYDCLLHLGIVDAVLLSENLLSGTSRNTGSDKQTYYKLSLCGSEADSIHSMAVDLFSGGAMDGDIALVEAALSVPSFLKLCGLGVPFPMNRYGEYVGYKTDHDPRKRATSVGPYTSRLMTEYLEKSLRLKDANLMGGYQVVKILVEDNEVRGVLCFTNATQEFCIVWCRNLIWATGGPAGIYADSVYPTSQFGANGLAFEAGCHGRNLTEWQYGMASVHPKWNVSGTYMQVLPRFFSCDENGNEVDFLRERFSNPYEMLSLVFLKGYEWPFDVRKIANGSSLIDLLVYQELEKGRKVFLDFSRNPLDGELEYSQLEEVAFSYLTQAKAVFGTPIERLIHMNRPAYEFYRDRGIDLSSTPLEITLAAQHNNGGIAVDCWWRTHVEGMFAVGEAAGTHGIYRPGGSALNAGQVGAYRAALYIAQHRHQDGWIPRQSSVTQILDFIHSIEAAIQEEDTAVEVYRAVRKYMTSNASLIRSKESIEVSLEMVHTYLIKFKQFSVSDKRRLPSLFRLRDCLISQYMYLFCMKNYIEKLGASRGSALYIISDGTPLHPLLPEGYKTRLMDASVRQDIQEVTFDGCVAEVAWRAPNPIPEEDDFFENIWKGYRENRNVF